MKYAYLAIFSPISNNEYDVQIPDLPGCRSCGKNLVDAIFMAGEAASMWLWHAESKSEPIPIPSASLAVEKPSFINYICADTDAYGR
jgi:predicted RNase H-like HicB family nuclease